MAKLEAWAALVESSTGGAVGSSVEPYDALSVRRHILYVLFTAMHFLLWYIWILSLGSDCSSWCRLPCYRRYTVSSWQQYRCPGRRSQRVSEGVEETQSSAVSQPSTLEKDCLSDRSHGKLEGGRTAAAFKRRLLLIFAYCWKGWEAFTRIKLLNLYVGSLIVGISIVIWNSL